MVQNSRKRSLCREVDENEKVAGKLDLFAKCLFSPADNTPASKWEMRHNSKRERVDPRQGVVTPTDKSSIEGLASVF